MPKKSADLVLQGGVTSAFVYIGLIRRLSRDYHFKCLGGASSGAVAAAAAAIAEHSRLHPPAGVPAFDPFQRLGAFPDALAALDANGETALFKLFQAQPASARAWRAASAAGRRLPAGLGAAAWAAGVAALRTFPLAAALGLALGALPAFALFAQRGGAMDMLAWLSLGAAVLVGVVLAGLGLLVGVGWAIWRSLVANHFGLCSGMGETHTSGPPDPDRLPLSWAFHGLFSQLAGRGLADDPITFGQLWGADDKRREIDLQVITTSLSLQRPFRLPGDPGVNPLQAFFYDPAEWREFFPGPVLKWLVDKRLSHGSVKVTNADGVTLLALPAPRDWPILLAARLSLSFPVLLSAVPMYTLDGARDRQPSAGEATRFIARRVYFSDGGITNNCPVQLFDAALPRRPTFVVKLAKLPEGHTQRWRVWLHGDAGDPPPKVKPIHGVFGFAGSLIGTLMGWRDQVQADLPGYRERSATVGLRAAEGGLN
ncbi:MAG: patatin-like phospholipase family protein, partial [Rubritepida sp.]|nr:patatin-like phospholipase family protein [Rubritepida sp.]